MCSWVYMSGRPINVIMEEIRQVLSEEQELSVRQIALRTGSQWVTVKKTLEVMKSFGIVKERIASDSNRRARLFSLTNGCG